MYKPLQKKYFEKIKDLRSYQADNNIEDARVYWNTNCFMWCIEYR